MYSSLGDVGCVNDDGGGADDDNNDNSDELYLFIQSQIAQKKCGLLRYDRQEKLDRIGFVFDDNDADGSTELS